MREVPVRTSFAEVPSRVIPVTALTFSAKSWMALAPAWSVAVILSTRLSTSPNAGVPLRLRVAASKVNQDGSGVPSTCVAEKLKISPASTSLKASAGRVKLKAAASVAVCAAITLATVGASFVLAMATLKLDEIVAPARSVAVTFRLRVLTSRFNGVPVKVPVAELKVSHAGSGVSSLSAADSVSTSPTSTSVKVSAGTLKLNTASSVAVCPAIARAVTGASLTLVTARLKLLDTLAPAESVAVTFKSRQPTSPFCGTPLKL